MGSINGIGGIFITNENPKDLLEWYTEVLGIDFKGQSYHAFTKAESSTAVFSVFQSPSDYLKPSDKQFMINFTVDDLEGFLNKIEKKGVKRLAEKSDYMEGIGHFNWIMDPAGNKLELWQPEV